MKIKKFPPPIFIALCELFTPHVSMASMLVYPMTVDIDNSREAGKSLYVYSHSDKVQYIRTRIMRIEHPGTQQEKEIPIDDTSDSGLVISPGKFILPSGAKKTVRIISARPPNSEEVWRVYFESVPESENDSLAASPRSSSVSVNLVWGVLLRVYPEKPLTVLRFDGDHLFNIGNSHASIQKVGYCNPSCQWVKINQSIYSGGSISLPSSVTKVNKIRVQYRIGSNAPLAFIDLFSNGKVSRH